ncbi:MAG: bifunctional phosphoribosylaminoimidazolecarboxamide formyltransferase/IMP cyclohydrolase PurH [Proteobacteria bacterium]|nr:bifunctional phosphoribosylaminoimidazolecarboxamide formyltransferase/IMP cyclohydrolase PurH [Pseudomonadota bacterium]
MKMKKAALISVSDRTGIIEFASGLTDLGLTLLTTSGSGKTLSEAGIAHTGIDQYTGQQEILDGRVKTLHPKIHAGLLARRDQPEHLQQLADNDILPIDVVAVNLYPFLEKVRSDAATNPEKMIEFIDIGGPTMLRAAAKNHSGVLPVIYPSDYPLVLEFLRTGSAAGKGALEFRRYLASRVFTAIAHYDLEIAKYMATIAEREGYAADTSTLGPVEGAVLQREQSLRYGENPHQNAALYRPFGAPARAWTQLNGKELSYNNLLDVDAALRVATSLPATVSGAVIIKHANPCGAAIGSTLAEALRKAKMCDPRSHFGGILAFNAEVTPEVAENIREDFAEVVLAPSFSQPALEILRSAKNLRVLQISAHALQPIEIRSVLDGVLMQVRDERSSRLAAREPASSRKPTESERKQLQFAWDLCAHVRSNAIVLVKDGMLVGCGAGQMSRVDSVELAISKAKLHGHDLHGAVAASDAFFPFSDGIEALAQAGIVAVVAPSGAKRDPEIVATADTLGISLIFTEDRHFRH